MEAVCTQWKCGTARRMRRSAPPCWRSAPTAASGPAPVKAGGAQRPWSTSGQPPRCGGGAAAAQLQWSPPPSCPLDVLPKLEAEGMWSCFQKPNLPNSDEAHRYFLTEPDGAFFSLSPSACEGRHMQTLPINAPCRNHRCAPSGSSSALSAGRGKNTQSHPLVIS